MRGNFYAPNPRPGTLHLYNDRLRSQRKINKSTKIVNCPRLSEMWQVNCRFDLDQPKARPPSFQKTAQQPTQQPPPQYRFRGHDRQKDRGGQSGLDQPAVDILDCLFGGQQGNGSGQTSRCHCKGGERSCRRSKAGTHRLLQIANPRAQRGIEQAPMFACHYDIAIRLNQNPCSRRTGRVAHD